MATLTVQSIDKDGITPTLATPTASTGDQAVVADDGRHFILVNNNSAGSINVTVSKQRATAPQAGVGADVAVADIVHAVGAGLVGLIPVLPAYIRTNDGVVQFTCSAVSDVLAGVIKLPRLA